LTPVSRAFVCVDSGDVMLKEQKRQIAAVFSAVSVTDELPF